MDRDAGWPAIEAGILAFFVKLFVTPVRLDAAFDCEDDCKELLLSSFPDMLDELRLDTTALMMIWKQENQRSLKRFRRTVAVDSMFRLPQPGCMSVQEQFQHLTKTSVHCILEMFTKRRQRKYFNCTCSVMFVGGTSLYEITTTFWLKVAFIAFNQAVVSIFFQAYNCSTFRRLLFISTQFLACFFSQDICSGFH